ncbi:MFS transporter [Vibrio sp. JC009]|uniref:MFS transporter n=1 Tax=Vibrio sp. JC009 TaxID=2912314 RepID=UPI0023AF31CF|nr:MFS transporter [Vibrio sp. JC009]WED23692.1 MFS transporter [Vibrio sp. JC009]
MKKEFDTKLLFRIGNLSIFMIGLGFAVRANIAPDLQADIYDKIDIMSSASMVGEALGATFIGFALTLLFGSAMVDKVGMKNMLLFSAFGYILSTGGLLAAAVLPVTDLSVLIVWCSLLLTGLGWGAVEAAANPMIAALFPEEKAHRLNVLHAWWPAGIVVGGLSGVLFSALDLPWQINLLLLFLPGLLMIKWSIGVEFPVTERVANGVSYKDMVLELVRRPLYWVIWACMFLTAASELAPGQWVNVALSNIVGMKGILLLVYVSGLMFVLRNFAGVVFKHISSVGLMTVSCVFAAAGLYALSIADSPLPAFLAATIWGIGVCYMWPTMQGIITERFPNGGALALGLLGFAGGLSIQFVLPMMGSIFDTARAEAAGGADKLATLSPEMMTEVTRIASVESFQAISVVPLIILPVFAIIWVYDKISKKNSSVTEANENA